MEGIRLQPDILLHDSVALARDALVEAGDARVRDGGGDAGGDAGGVERVGKGGVGEGEAEIVLGGVEAEGRDGRGRVRLWGRRFYR